jgi:hypothetical protein
MRLQVQYDEKQNKDEATIKEELFISKKRQNI